MRWLIEEADGVYKEISIEEIEGYAKDHKVVQRDRIGGLLISTVWLGFDYRYGEGPPLIYETMIFEDGDFFDLFCARYSRWVQAKEGHEAVLRIIQDYIDKKITEEELNELLDSCSRRHPC